MRSRNFKWKRAAIPRTWEAPAAARSISSRIQVPANTMERFTNFCAMARWMPVRSNPWATITWCKIISAPRAGRRPDFDRSHAGRNHRGFQHEQCENLRPDYRCQESELQPESADRAV